MDEQHNLAKWLAGEMDEKELEVFQKSPDFAIYRKIAQHTSQLKAPDFNSEKMYANITQSQNAPIKAIPLHKTLAVKVAAVLIVGLALFFTVRPRISHSQLAENGRRTTFLLPDDSKVALNSGSTVSYKKWNWKNHRAVDLNGEAFFTVAKGAAFEVNTISGKVTVVGTQFNVKARNKRFEIECFEGKVSIQYGKSKTLISDGEILVLESGKPIEANPTNSNAPYWLQKGIRFTSTLLPEICFELERQYDIKIELRGQSEIEKFTGILPSDDLTKALCILANTYHLQFNITKNKVVLITNG